MSWITINTKIGSKQYYMYQMEIDTTGNLCIGFASYEEGQYKVYSSNFLDATPDWTAVYISDTNVLACASFTDTNGDLYVFRLMNTTTNEVICYKLQAIGVFSNIHVPISDSDPAPSFTPYSIAVNKTGTTLMVSGNKGIYMVVANSGIVPELDNSYYHNSFNTAIQLQCSVQYADKGIFIDKDYGIIYSYYVLSDVFYARIIPQSINDNKFSSNLELIELYEYLYTVNSDGYIYYSKIFFDDVNTSINITTPSFSTSYPYTYTHLKLYDSDNFIFSSATALVYSVSGVLSSYTTADRNFSWCAISDIQDGNIYLCGCNDTTDVFLLQSQIPCFLKGTQITILENNQEIEKNIELLKQDDLVKVNPQTFKKIKFIGSRRINTNDYLNTIKVLPKGILKNNLPTQNLYLTTGHSLLFKNLDFANEFYNANVYEDNIEDYHKIMTQHCSLCYDVGIEELKNVLEDDKYVSVYHFSLDHELDNGQYAVYSNGVRSECMSHEFAVKSNLV